jgi:hypothetical protein
MSKSFLNAQAVHSDTGLEIHSLFQDGKAFVSEANPDQARIYAYRFLSGPITAAVPTRSIDMDAQKAVNFKEYKRRNCSSQWICNKSQLNDFLLDKWTDYERPERATNSSYVLYGDDRNRALL